MKKRIIVFGATGYTGSLTVEALLKRGIKPIIAGRNKKKLDTISSKHNGLEIIIADINDTESVKKILKKGDILISTVGPFIQYGKTALEAAISAGADYIDSTGEIAFARQVIEKYNSEAKSAEVSLHTASGYDFIPGNCAGAVALNRAGEKAVRIDIGYFDSGKGKLILSQGTLASLVHAVLHPGVFWKKNKMVEKIAGTRLKRFKTNSGKRPAISISSTEHFFLPKEHIQLKEVNVYLGWFGWISYFLQISANFYSILSIIPGFSKLLQITIPKLFKSKGKGPGIANRSETGSYIIAIAYDKDNNELSKAELSGVNGYTFTVNMLAALADKVSESSFKKTGTISPIDTFGLKELIQACDEAGLKLLT